MAGHSSGPAKHGNHTPAGAPAAVGFGELADRYNAVLTRAGGEDLWLKRAARPAAPQDAAPRGEVLVLSTVTESVVAGLKRQASADGLEVTSRAQGSPPAGGPGALDLTLSKSGQVVCSWQIRPVARLYRAAIVIDDLGQDLKTAHQLLEIPYPLTFSVLPHLPASRETAIAVARGGREVMLHLPMEPLAGPRLSPGQGALLVGMGATEVDGIVEADLASVPNAAGVNNHMGSRATSDPALMAEVMKELAARRLFFIDSRTAPSTLAFDAAREAGVPAFYRSVFLDNTETVDYTLDQLRSFRALVERQGVALAIGHPHPTTIAALGRFLPELERADVELVPASRLVRLPEVARLAPPQGGSKAGGD